MHPHERGRLAEEAAARFLSRLGYELVERNWRCDLGELDLIARQDGDLVFVEVRSRADDEHGAAVYAVDATKRRQVMRVATRYLLDVRPACTTCRFDVVAVTGETIELFRDAFRVGI